jgi:hypothetical protein
LRDWSAVRTDLTRGHAFACHAVPSATFRLACTCASLKVAAIWAFISSNAIARLRDKLVEARFEGYGHWSATVRAHRGHYAQAVNRIEFTTSFFAFLGVGLHLASIGAQVGFLLAFAGIGVKEAAAVAALFRRSFEVRTIWAFIRVFNLTCAIHLVEDSIVKLTFRVSISNSCPAVRAKIG